MDEQSSSHIPSPFRLRGRALTTTGGEKQSFGDGAPRGVGQTQTMTMTSELWIAAADGRADAYR
jgi:hypothetical protein